MSTVTTHTRPSAAAAPSAQRMRWLGWSRAWTTQANRLTRGTGTPPLTVTVEPLPPGSPPAWCLPATGEIHVDATLIGAPTIADPFRPGHKKTVPAAYGALVHEVAHCVHSHWATPPGTPPILDAVAQLLEESRIEYRHRSRRPRDRQYLRSAVRKLIDPSDTPVDDSWNAAYAAGLLLARVDAGILTTVDVRAVRAPITRILTRRVLRTLRVIWRQAHQVPDTDATTMLDLARRWLAAIGINPNLSPAIPTPPPGARPGALAAAVAAAITALDPHHQPTPPPPPPGTAHGSSPTAPPTTGGGIGSTLATTVVPAHWKPRLPTPAERAAATKLAAALRRARTREPVTTRETTALPPGRLHIRGAVAAAAQRTAGIPPTAQPWQRTTRRMIPDPELSLAVLVDISGSMHDYAKPASSAAWILAHAGARIHARTTAIAYGETVTILVPPATRPTQVHDIQADHGAHAIRDALTTADHLLGLSHPGRVRMAVIISDGQYAPDENPQAAIDRLHAAGCPILWLQPANLRCITYPRTTPITVTNPVDCTAIIGAAATQALRHT